MGQNGAVPEQRAKYLMLVIAACVIFLILLFIPFIPGILELRRPRDAAPLFIDMEYTKDPRYFGKSFKSAIKKYVPSDSLQTGLRNIALSQKEEILVSSSRTVPAGEKVNYILCIAGDLISEEKAYFHKEIYATGNVVLGSNNVVKALASDGKILLHRHTTVLRWADAEEAVEVSEGCNLGISLSCAGEIRIAHGCTFQRLYGFPIITYSTDGEHEGKYPDLDSMASGRWNGEKDVSAVPQSARIVKDLIVKNNLRIAKNCIITGNIKSYRELVIEAGVTVNGNIFSEEDITIEEHAVVDGNIFCQGRVIIRGNAQIGRTGKMKSVIGKSSVILGRNVRVYGYIQTEGSGLVW